jgi:transposase
MDGFTGIQTATSEELPDAVAVMDPFHLVRLAGDALGGQARMRAVIDSDVSGVRPR